MAVAMAWPWHDHGHGMATAMAMSLGPTSLYADKPSPKNDPFFGTLKKNRSVRTIKVAVVSRRDLSFSTLSQRKPFTKNTQILGVATTAATAAAEEFPVPARPHPITQGYHIPFGSRPSLRRDGFDVFLQTEFTL